MRPFLVFMVFPLFLLACADPEESVDPLSVDNETEAAIQRSLERAAVGRTTLVIAHRLSTIRNAGKIIVLHEGKITESGNHAELIAANGLYKRLWDVQTGLQS